MADRDLPSTTKKTRQDGAFVVFSRSVIFGRKAAAPHHGGDSPHPTPMVKLDYSALQIFWHHLEKWRLIAVRIAPAKC